MTPKAQKLASDNYKLIYHFMKQHNIDPEEINDFYGLLAEAFCNACEKYDEKSGYEFSTFAFTFMNNAMHTEYYKQNAIKRKSNSDIEIYLDAKQKSNKHTGLINDYYEKIADANASAILDLVESTIDNQRLISKIWDIANDNQREYISMLYEGMNGAEIARKIGITRQGINVRRNELLKACERHNIVYERG